MNDALAIKCDAVPLPPFSGDAPTCPKCGNEGASTTFKAYGDCLVGEDHAMSQGWHANERLCRRCARCGYGWDEATTEARSRLDDLVAFNPRSAAQANYADGVRDAMRVLRGEEPLGCQDR